MPRIASTFLCALTVVQALLIQKPLRTDAVTGFIGSATCAWCHKAQAEKQSASSMARAAFRPQLHPLFDRFRNQEARTATVKFSFLWKDEQFQFVVSQGDGESRFLVQWAFGSGRHAVTFVSKMGGGAYLESRVSYYPEIGRLDFTPGRDNTEFGSLQQAAGHINERAESFRCISCHTTGSRMDPGEQEIVLGELGVRCEACHGPGLAHFEAVKRGDRDRAAKAVGSFKRDSAEEVLRLCGKCHREPPQDSSRVDWKDPANTRFQPVGLSQSRCFRQGRLSCTTCHDPHTDARRADPRFYASICASCHNSSKNPPAGLCLAETPGGCVSCHMPRVPAMRAIVFTNHWIGVYPSADKLVPRQRTR